MIRPIDIRLNAAHPELPLVEATTFTGASSSVFIRGVPRAVGNWSITAVNVAVTYPDNSTTTRAAVESAEGVWVATIPATATSGRTENGLRVMADGFDENGAAVMGYILGVADFAVASLAVTPAPQPGETSYQMLYFDAVPGVLRKGDVTKVDGVLKFYNGEAWEAFATPPTLDDAVTRTSANGVKSSGIWSALWGALAALPTGFSSLYDWCVAQLAGKASKADATLTERGDPQTPGFSEWQFGELTYSDPGGDGWSWTFQYPTYSQGMWTTEITNGPDFITMTAAGAEDATTLAFTGFGEGITASGTLTRTALPGYQLGNDDQHILASEAEAEALRAAVAAKYTKPSGGIPATDLAAAVQTSLGKANTALQAHQQLNNNRAALQWGISVSGGSFYGLTIEWDSSSEKWVLKNDGEVACYDGAGNAESLFLQWPAADNMLGVDVSATRQMAGWVLGMQEDKPIATAAQGALAQTAVQPAALPYALVTKTISNGAVTLDDRASNSVTISATLSPNTLTVNFPTATSGKARDFGLRLTVASGITTAPELALPQGVVCENADGEAPEIGADGAATILYFTETASGVFLVKGEVVTAIS